ncbi:helix-turn-helix domain-containing protein [Anaerofustis stercorihominis]|uniref:helix-turn-helix domain-containing protein n=1 Tax=Anaerofustis stercorihominis TaxID=214853 RepID=UPI001FA8306D|nr:helix-turn-helix domain-containing protein [Anaerofustis stercorihominis]
MIYFSKLKIPFAEGLGTAPSGVVSSILWTSKEWRVVGWNPKIVLSHIENGSTKVSLQTIVNIANILNISLDDLLDLDLGKRSMYLTIREIDLMFKDCTKEERKILIDNLNYLKKVELKIRIKE